MEELDWPAQSPDFNPSQHLWDELEQMLRAKPSHPTSLPDLTNTLQDEYKQKQKKIHKETLQHLVESLPRRVEAL